MLTLKSGGKMDTKDWDVLTAELGKFLLIETNRTVFIKSKAADSL